jgi:hypothetical protein
MQSALDPPAGERGSTLIERICADQKNVWQNDAATE